MILFHIYQNNADSMARLNSENCGRKIKCYTALILLATRVLLASPNFGEDEVSDLGTIELHRDPISKVLSEW